MMGSERVRRHPHPALDLHLVQLLLRSRRLMGPGPQLCALKAIAAEQQPSLLCRVRSA